MSDSVSGRKKQSSAAGFGKDRQEKGHRSCDMSVYKSSGEETVRQKTEMESSVQKGSEEYFDYKCDHCSSAGENVEAQGFCIDCKEYLCVTCSRSKLSKYHKLLDKDSMPQNTFKSCDACEEAWESEEATGYCVDCKEYLCVSCFKGHSRSKLSRHHILLNKDSMTKYFDGALLSSITKIGISKDGDEAGKFTEEYTFVSSINVKAVEDDRYCYITGMTLMSKSLLVLTDKNNKCLKLVNIETNRVQDTLRLLSVPNGITTISKDKVAVVLEEEKLIVIISISTRMSLVRKLTTRGICVGVKCFNEKLHVSFDDPVTFQIIDFSGSVEKTIRPHYEVRRYCTLPRHIDVNPDGSWIYVSDWKENRVFCIDMNENLMSVYRGEIDHPYEITISPFGSIYLCSRDQDIVYKISSDLKEGTVVLGPKDGLVGPQAMCIILTNNSCISAVGVIKANMPILLKYINGSM